MSEAQKRAWARRRKAEREPPTAGQKPRTHIHGGCPSCPPKPVILDLDDYLHPGFGMVTIRKNGRAVYPFGDDYHAHDDLTGRMLERVAIHSLPARWEIVVDGPLSGWKYRRIAQNTWTMVERNRGFA